MENKTNVKNNTEQIHSLPGSNEVLKPGLNQVSSDAWDKAKEHQVIQKRIEAKDFEEQTASEAKTGTPASEAQHPPGQPIAPPPPGTKTPAEKKAEDEKNDKDGKKNQPRHG